MNNVIHRSIEDKTGEKVFGFFVRLSFNIFRLFYIILRTNKQTTNWSKMRAFKLKWEYERQMSLCFAHISPHSHIRHSNWHMKYRALLNVLKCNEMAFYRSISFSFRVRACACRACLCIKKHVKRVLRLSKHIKQHCKNDKIIASQLLCCVCLRWSLYHWKWLLWVFMWELHGFCALARVATPNPGTTVTEILILIRARMRTDFNKVSRSILGHNKVHGDDVLNEDDEVTWISHRLFGLCVTIAHLNYYYLSVISTLRLWRLLLCIKCILLLKMASKTNK